MKSKGAPCPKVDVRWGCGQKGRMVHVQKLSQTQGRGPGRRRWPGCQVAATSAATHFPKVLKLKNSPAPLVYKGTCQVPKGAAGCFPKCATCPNDIKAHQVQMLPTGPGEQAPVRKQCKYTPHLKCVPRPRAIALGTPQLPAHEPLRGPIQPNRQTLRPVNPYMTAPKSTR